MYENWLLPALVLVAAILYSSVGHAGASGYLAAMALVGMAPDSMKPTALVLNLFVSCVVLVRFYRAKQFSFRILWPFLIGSIPFAYLGGAMTLPGKWYKIIVGVILVLAASRLLSTAKSENVDSTNEPPIGLSILIGSVIGFVAGLTGTGGGIFLSPLLLLMKWSPTRVAAGISSAFILANSAAGLLGATKSLVHVPKTIPILVITAIVGALIGTELGTKRLAIPVLRSILGVVLIIAGLKLALT